MRHCNVIGCALFQFTHPGKGATVWCCRSADRYLVSIHAPWEGCDPSPWRDLAYTPFGFNSRTLGRVRHTRDFCQASSICFNSRTLGRVRHHQLHPFQQGYQFQFTHPGKGATHATITSAPMPYVSIHAPWEGCDKGYCTLTGEVYPFQFTHPGKGATRRATQGT